LPLDQAIPVGLISKITKFCVKRNLEKAVSRKAAKKSKAAKRKDAKRKEAKRGKAQK
jgi:hypothetical protein